MHYTLDDYEYFIWQFAGNINVKRGIPTGTGWQHTVEVAKFSTDELGDDVAMNHAYSLLCYFQELGRNVRWEDKS